MFVYGSLMLPGLAIRRVRETVTDEDESNFVQRMTPAWLSHHNRFVVRDSPFCALVDQGAEGDVVEGFLIFGLTAEERGRLDRFEAGKYSRETVEVVIVALERPDSTEIMTYKLDVETYIWAGATDQLVPVTETEWSIENFVLTSEYGALAGDEHFQQGSSGDLDSGELATSMQDLEISTKPKHSPPSSPPLETSTTPKESPPSSPLFHE